MSNGVIDFLFLNFLGGGGERDFFCLCLKPDSSRRQRNEVAMLSITWVWNYFDIYLHANGVPDTFLVRGGFFLPPSPKITFFINYVACTCTPHTPYFIDILLSKICPKYFIPKKNRAWLCHSPARTVLREAPFQQFV